jgi:hypothetical protein
MQAFWNWKLFPLVGSSLIIFADALRSVLGHPMSYQIQMWLLSRSAAKLVHG